MSSIAPIVTVVDYGVGNIAALINMFDHLGIEAVTAADAGGIAAARLLVLPGVGAFDRAMSALQERELITPLNRAVRDHGVPVLGVCLGMQLLGRGSEEGARGGLDWIPAEVRRIRLAQGSTLKVPHIGWADVHPARESALFPAAGCGEEPERFYFVHSYHMVCDDTADVLATVQHGSDLCCAVQRGNVTGVQFHPEKSHRFGMRLLRTWTQQSIAGASTC